VNKIHRVSKDVKQMEKQNIHQGQKALVYQESPRFLKWQKIGLNKVLPSISINKGCFSSILDNIIQKW